MNAQYLQLAAGQTLESEQEYQAVVEQVRSSFVKDTVAKTRWICLSEAAINEYSLQIINTWNFA